jgi:hypothetical protein
MALRLFRRSTDPEIVVGRHSRPRVGPTVPGAAATLVAAAASWDHEPAREPAPGPPSVPPAPVTATTDDVHTAPSDAAPYPDPEPALVSAGVSLGFADGAQIDLPADDPRVRTFHAAAAALLEAPPS